MNGNVAWNIGGLVVTLIKYRPLERQLMGAVKTFGYGTLSNCYTLKLRRCHISREAVGLLYRLSQ